MRSWTLALIATLAGAPSLQALDWVNTLCPFPLPECAQVGPPVAACGCGLWKDSPIKATEAAYVFAQSNSPTDETARWIASLPLPHPLVGVLPDDFDQLRVRAAVNDSAIFQVVAYSVDPAPANCPTAGPGVLGVVTWDGAEDNSRLRGETVTLAPAQVPIASLCLILTDDPDAIVPDSERTSVLVDRIELRNSVTRAVSVVEEFDLDL